MGVFEKTPYTNFHNLNLNWIIKKIKEVAKDNELILKLFKHIEDEKILGVVTDVTESTNTATLEYYDKDTQAFEDLTLYTNTGTDSKIASAISPISNRMTAAEVNINNLTIDVDAIDNTINTMQNSVIYRYVNIGSKSILHFIHDTNNPIGSYILDVQNSPDNPAGAGSVAVAIVYKKQLNGAYSTVYVYKTDGAWVNRYAISASTANLYWKRLDVVSGTGYAKLGTEPILIWGQITHNGENFDTITLPTAISGIDSIVTTPLYSGGTITPIFIMPDIRDLTNIRMYVRNASGQTVTTNTNIYCWYAIAH